MLQKRKPEEDVRFSSIGFKDGCELLCGCWEMSLQGPLEEQLGLLTTESFLQSLADRFLFYLFFILRQGFVALPRLVFEAFSVVQVGLELLMPLLCASELLGLKVCIIRIWPLFHFL